jgi:predicted AlkP superfamily pyrophosphatase or phosphodiesterase
MADLVLAAKEGYSFTGEAQGEVVTEVPGGQVAGSHGYLSRDQEMNAIFIAWGRGIQPGKQLEVIKNLDVAPTVAALLNLQMRGIDGKALAEILKP